MIDKIKFPRTAHVYSERRYREDLQLSELETKDLFENELIIQEKVDGANLGLYMKDGEIYAINRNTPIDYSITRNDQFKKLGKWINNNYVDLSSILEDNKMLFGEWLYAEHSVRYDNLPSYFLSFDIFDLNEEKFVSQTKLEDILEDTDISYNPVLYKGRINSISDLDNLMVQSQFGPEKMEGLYLRVDDENHLVKRNKYVGAHFIQAIEEDGHWKNKGMKINKSNNVLESYWSN